jgi:hypothetical protein
MKMLNGLKKASKLHGKKHKLAKPNATLKVKIAWRM